MVLWACRAGTKCNIRRLRRKCHRTCNDFHYYGMTKAPRLALAGHEVDENDGGWNKATGASGLLLDGEHVHFTCCWWLAPIAEIRLRVSEIEPQSAVGGCGRHHRLRCKTMVMTDRTSGGSLYVELTGLEMVEETASKLKCMITLYAWVTTAPRRRICTPLPYLSLLPLVGLLRYNGGRRGVTLPPSPGCILGCATSTSHHDDSRFRQIDVLPSTLASDVRVVSHPSQSSQFCHRSTSLVVSMAPNPLALPLCISGFRARTEPSPGPPLTHFVLGNLLPSSRRPTLTIPRYVAGTSQRPGNAVYSFTLISFWAP